MKIETLREIIQKTHNGSSIQSFNMISGDKFKSPNFRLSHIVETDGTLILKSPGREAVNRNSKEVILIIDYIESITHFA